MGVHLSTWTKHDQYNITIIWHMCANNEGFSILSKPTHDELHSSVSTASLTTSRRSAPTGVNSARFWEVLRGGVREVGVRRVGEGGGLTSVMMKKSSPGSPCFTICWPSSNCTISSASAIVSRSHLSRLSVARGARQ